MTSAAKPTAPSIETELHKNALLALTEADRALAHAPSLVIEDPHLLSDINLPLLQSVLAEGTAGAELESLGVEDEHSGMTARKKWELNWNAAGVAAELPKSVFVKATPDEPEHREMLAVLHMHELEANFYQHIQPSISDISPQAYYAKSYPGGRFLILLEDLEASGCKPYWLKDQVSIEHIEACTVALATLHAKFWESDRLATDLAWVRPRTSRFGWPWLNEMTKVVRGAFPQMVDETILPPDVKEVLELWGQHADTVFDYFETLPHTALHGDSHLGNTFSYPDGRAGFFDWQVMFSGHGLRDFAYFFFTAVTEEDRKIHEKRIFQLYLDTLADKGVALDKDEAWNIYCLFVLDRWDANITAYVHGTYNHDTTAQERGLLATNGSIIDNDIRGRLLALIEKIESK